MSGRRLRAFRHGDRSEYLAMYALSSIAFVNPVSRQEDFGVVDARCVLGTERDKVVVPENEFYVQVKSSKRRFIFDREAMQWIASYMDHPLFICVVGRTKQLISIYSASPIWHAAFNDLTATEGPRPVSVELDTPLNDSPPSFNSATRRWDVKLGPPILEETVIGFDDQSERLREVLKSWLIFDLRNVAQRGIGRLSVSLASTWSTNTPLPDPATGFTLWYFGPSFPRAEKQLTATLIGLLHNYRNAVRSGMSDVATVTKFVALSKLLDTFAAEDPKLAVVLKPLRELHDPPPAS